MTTYIDNALTKDEKLIYVGNISAWSLAPLILLGFLFLFAWGIGLLFWLAALIRYQTTELGITNKRVIAKFGFVSRRTIELNIQKIEGIEVIQGIFGRLFDYGSLLVSGVGSLKEPIPGISNPLGFRRAFMDAQDAAPLRQT